MWSGKSKMLVGLISPNAFQYLDSRRETLSFGGEESWQKVLEVSSFAELRIQIFENRLVANDEDTSILVSCPLDT